MIDWKYVRNLSVVKGTLEQNNGIQKDHQRSVQSYRAQTRKIKAYYSTLLIAEEIRGTQ